MENQFKMLTQEIKEKILGILAETKSAIEKAQESGEDLGRFEVIISTADQDRAGEIIALDAWDLTHYKNNPVVLWAHDYSQLPVGSADSVELKDGNLVATGTFAPHEFAQSVRRLYDLKMLRATSVGLIPRKMVGNTITEAELLEFSFVPVPANPYALSLAKSAMIEMETLITKGFVIKAEIEAPAVEPAPVEEIKEEIVETVEEEKKEEVIEPVEKDDQIVQADEKVEEETTETGEVETEQETEEVVETTEKGMVADEMEFDYADYDMKWRQLEPLEHIIYKFYDVYFRNSVKADQFKELATEMVQLLSAAIEGAVIETKGAIQNEIDAEITSDVAIQIKTAMTVARTKAGKVLSEANRTLIQECVDNMTKTSAALSDLLANTSGSEKSGKPASPDKKVEPVAGMDLIKSFDEFLINQRFLRAVSTATSKALESLNKAKTKKIN